MLPTGHKADLTVGDLEALERALCTLVDFEGVLKDELARFGVGEQAHAAVCAVLRELVD